MSQVFDLTEWNDLSLWGFLFASFGVALLSVIIMEHGSKRDQWHTQLTNPSWAPPPAVIALIWFILFFLIAFAGFRGDKFAQSVNHRRVLNGMFAIQLLLLLIWAWVITAWKDLTTGFYLSVILLIVSIIWIFILFPIDRLSAYLLIIYVLWLILLSVLSYQLMIENPRNC